MDETDAREVFEWWVLSSQFDGMTGRPSGPPEWPLPGGMQNQPAKLVEAVVLLRSEWDRWAANDQAEKNKSAQKAER